GRGREERVDLRLRPRRHQDLLLAADFQQRDGDQLAAVRQVGFALEDADGPVAFLHPDGGGKRAVEVRGVARRQDRALDDGQRLAGRRALGAGDVRIRDDRTQNRTEYENTADHAE